MPQTPNSGDRYSLGEIQDMANQAEASKVTLYRLAFTSREWIALVEIVATIRRKQSPRTERAMQMMSTAEVDALPDQDTSSLNLE